MRGRSTSFELAVDAIRCSSSERQATFEVSDGEAWLWDEAQAPEPVDDGYRFEVFHGETESEISINGTEQSLPLMFSPAGGAALNVTSTRF